MKLPTRVAVLSRIYTVKRVAQRTLDRDHGSDNRVLADCYPELAVIRISKDVGDEQAVGLLEHELAHGFIFEFGMGTFLNAEQEEQIVTNLLPAWLGAVRPRK